MGIKVTQLCQPALAGEKNIYLYSGDIKPILICLIYKNEFRNKNQKTENPDISLGGRRVRSHEEYA